eukprot:gene8350-biopygen2752
MRWMRSSVSPGICSRSESGRTGSRSGRRILINAAVSSECDGATAMRRARSCTPIPLIAVTVEGLEPGSDYYVHHCGGDWSLVVTNSLLNNECNRN